MNGTEAGRALLPLAFLLPILCGGNVLLFLEPGPALGAFAILAGVVGLLWTLRPPARSVGGLVPAWALLSLAVITSASYALRPSGPSAPKMAAAIALAALLFTVLRRRSFTSEELRGFFAAISAGTLVTVAYGQYQHWEAFPRIAPILRASGIEPIESVNANFYNANSYAAFLAATVVMTASLLFASRSQGLRWFAGLALPPLLATLWLTRSRSMIALLTLAGAAMLARRWRREIPLALLASVGAMALFLAAFALAGWTELIQVGLLGRLRIWQSALAMISDHWFGGVGLGLFGEAFSRYQLGSYYTRYPHNFWLEVFAELGVLAAIALAVSVIAALRDASARRALEPAERCLRSAAALAAVLMIGHAFVDIDWHAPANPILTFALLAAAGGAQGQPSSRSNEIS